MAARWVFRRPPQTVRRRFVPYHKRNNALVFPPRRTAASLRRVRRIIRRRLLVLAGRSRTATPFSAFGRLRARRTRRFRARGRLALALGRAAAGQLIAQPQRRSRRRPQRKQPQRPKAVATVTPAAPANNLSGPIGRFRKAVARMRDQLRARLRWRPSPPVPLPEFEPQIQNPKLRIASPGLIRGDVSGGPL